jgi:hypothetical protein
MFLRREVVERDENDLSPHEWLEISMTFDVRQLVY